MSTDPTVYDEEINRRATASFKDSATHLLERIPRYLEILQAHKTNGTRRARCFAKSRYPSPSALIMACSSRWSR